METSAILLFSHVKPLQNCPHACTYTLWENDRYHTPNYIPTSTIQLPFFFGGGEISMESTAVLSLTPHGKPTTTDPKKKKAVHPCIRAHTLSGGNDEVYAYTNEQHRRHTQNNLFSSGTQRRWGVSYVCVRFHIVNSPL